MSESSEYLKNIADRMVAYDSIRECVLDFVDDNEIDSEEAVVSLMIMGFLWEARNRGEVLLEEDLNLLLGVEETEEYTYSDSDHNLSFILDDDRADLELEELLDLTLYDMISDDDEEID